MSQPKAPAPLYKQKSWSPDAYRDEAWSRRQDIHRQLRRSSSLTDDDLDELKACFELGFGFESADLDPKLSKAFPALELYHAVNRQYSSNQLSRSSSSSTMISDCDTITSPPVGTPNSICDPGESPEIVKTRLRHWAQVVACSVRQFSTH